VATTFGVVADRFHPLPALAAYVSVAGRRSVSVMAPVVAALPTFVTVIA